MAFVPERPSPGGSHSAYLETKDAIYHLMSCIEGLIPRITARRERREVFELLGRLERLVIEMMLVEEFDEEFLDEPLDSDDEEPETGERGA